MTRDTDAPQSGQDADPTQDAPSHWRQRPYAVHHSTRAERPPASETHSAFALRASTRLRQPDRFTVG